MARPTPEKIALLNQGAVEAKNLMELLAIDFHILMAATFPHIKLTDFPPKTGIVTKMKLVSQALYEQGTFAIFESLHTHTSDTIRGLGCYVLAHHPLDFKKKLDLIRPLADDANSGVREWAWIALRPEVAAQHLQAIEFLEPWTAHSSDRIRRYACEITRPRGVWCQHIPALRQKPWQAQKLLEALKNDPAKYVQLSVGNWLNDAGKDHPTWVRDLCDQWLQESPTPHTQKICKRALRNLKGA